MFLQKNKQKNNALFLVKFNFLSKCVYLRMFRYFTKNGVFFSGENLIRRIKSSFDFHLTSLLSRRSICDFSLLLSINFEVSSVLYCLQPCFYSVIL